jgi:UDP-2,4-diacetamido-2,4,6-trideoxy-beta-L-altropyranose hydrolase
MEVIFRTDSSVKIGSGHVTRCLTLAETLRRNGASVLFVTREHKGHLNKLIIKKGFDIKILKKPVYEINRTIQNKDIYYNWLGVSEEQDAKDTINVIGNYKPNWLIIDHYSLSEKWEKKLRPFSKNIFVIDDIANRRHDCDLLLDQNWFENMETRYDSLTPKGCEKLLGPKYALLREEFTQQKKNLKSKNKVVKRVFVFFGGSDPKNLTAMTLHALLDLKLSHLKVDVVIGGGNPFHEQILKLTKLNDNIRLHIQIDNMALIMSKADLAIGSGGVNTWERMCLGLPSLVIGFADNHKILLKDLIKNSYITYLGGISDINVNSLKEKILTLLTKTDLLEDQRKQGFKLIGYNGRNLVSEKIMKKEITITILSDDDSWINAHIPNFIINLKKMNSNNHIFWVHKVDDIPQGNICILLGCSQIIKKKNRQKNNNNIVVHESALPSGKGWSPLSWQIIEGKNSIPITLFEAEDKMDCGDIYLQDYMLFEGHELVEEIRTIQAKFSFNLCSNFINEYPTVLNNAKKQKGLSSYYKKRELTSSKLDLNKTLLEQFNLLRVVDNHKYPAYFEKENQVYKLKIEKII